MRRIVPAALVFITSFAPMGAQAPARFDVASVKPDPKQDRGGPQKLGEFSMPMVRVLPGGRW